MKLKNIKKLRAVSFRSSPATPNPGVVIEDYGTITAAPTSTEDYGSINQPATIVIDYGTIA